MIRNLTGVKIDHNYRAELKVFPKFGNIFNRRI